MSKTRVYAKSVGLKAASFFIQEDCPCPAGSTPHEPLEPKEGFKVVFDEGNDKWVYEEIVDEVEEPTEDQ